MGVLRALFVGVSGSGGHGLTWLEWKRYMAMRPWVNSVQGLRIRGILYMPGMFFVQSAGLIRAVLTC